MASQDKESLLKESISIENVEPKNIIKDPYVLEFLGLEGKKSFYEKDLEQSIIDAYLETNLINHIPYTDKYYVK